MPNKILVIKKRQFDILRELKAAVIEVGKQAAAVVTTIVAGDDENITHWKYKDISNSDGVYQLILEVPEGKTSPTESPNGTSDKPTAD